MVTMPGGGLRAPSGDGCLVASDGCVRRAGRRWVSLLTLFAILPWLSAARCLPSDPAPPVGVRSSADGVEESTDLEVLYMACPGERIVDVVLEISPRPGLPAEQLAWRLRVDAEPDHDGGLVALRVADAEQDLQRLGSQGLVEGREYAVVVTTSLFDGGVVFAPEELDRQLVTAPDGLLSQEEFEERYACEANRT
jgi:hypothetical protein